MRCGNLWVPHPPRHEHHQPHHPRFRSCRRIAPAFAQAPSPVPALPDTERRTSYTISNTTCACAVGFALYGDSTDYGNWVEVWLNGALVSSANYTITSPSGPLATLPRPITDAVLTFTSVQTGTVQIVGARRRGGPRNSRKTGASQRETSIRR